MGGEVLAFAADVRDFQQMKDLADAAYNHFARIDTWVHSAAVMMYAKFEETAPAEFRQMIDVNLMGQVYGAMAALPYLKKTGGGALIHLSSVEGMRSLPMQSAYAASKHALDGYLNAFRLEAQKEGLPISVTSIRPAGINTPLYGKALTRLGVKPQPVQPFYQPEAVVQAILYASEHPVREIVVGGAGKLLSLVQRASPRLADLVLRLIAFQGQRSDQMKSPNAPNNLFQHLDGYDRVRGNLSGFKRSSSLYTWLQTNPAALWAVGLLSLSGLAWISSRSLRLRNR
jgi:short-subunit dehydrogenase